MAAITSRPSRPTMRGSMRLTDGMRRTRGRTTSGSRISVFARRAITSRKLSAVCANMKSFTAPPADDRFLQLTASPIDLGAGRPIVGIDVGEDFLDLAALEKGWTCLRYARIGLKDIESAPIDTIADRLRAIASPITVETFAIVDSPRWPRALSRARTNRGGRRRGLSRSAVPPLPR